MLADTAPTFSTRQVPLPCIKVSSATWTNTRVCGSSRGSVDLTVSASPSDFSEHELRAGRGGEDADRLGATDVLGVAVAPGGEDFGDPIDHGVEEDRISGVDPGRQVADRGILGLELSHEARPAGVERVLGHPIRGQGGDQSPAQLKHPGPRQPPGVRGEFGVQLAGLISAQVEAGGLGGQLAGPKDRQVAAHRLTPQQRMPVLEIHQVTDQPGRGGHRDALQGGDLQRDELVVQRGTVGSDPHRAGADHVVLVAAGHSFAAANSAIADASSTSASTRALIAERSRSASETTINDALMCSILLREFPFNKDCRRSVDSHIQDGGAHSPQLLTDGAVSQQSHGCQETVAWVYSRRVRQTVLHGLIRSPRADNPKGDPQE